MKKPLTAIFLLVVAACPALAQSSKAPDELLKGFLAAVQANSYEGMVAPLVAEGGEIAAAAGEAGAEGREHALTREAEPGAGASAGKRLRGHLDGHAQVQGLSDLLVEAGVQDGGDDDLAYGIVTMDGRFRNFGVRPPGFVQGAYLTSAV